MTSTTAPGRWRYGSVKVSAAVHHDTAAAFQRAIREEMRLLMRGLDLELRLSAKPVIVMDDYDRAVQRHLHRLVIDTDLPVENIADAIHLNLANVTRFYIV